MRQARRVKVFLAPAHARKLSSKVLYGAAALRQAGRAARPPPLACHCAVHTWPQDGTTPLHAAALMGHLKVVKAFLAAGADKDAMSAVSDCHRMLGGWRAAPPPLSCHCAFHTWPQDGSTPLYLAAGRGFMDIVKALLAAGAKRDATVAVSVWERKICPPCACLHDSMRAGGFTLAAWYPAHATLRRCIV